MSIGSISDQKSGSISYLRIARQLHNPNFTI